MGSMSWRRLILSGTVLVQCSMVHDLSRLSICAYVCCLMLRLGIIIVLFFQCISTLLDPINRTRRGTKWLMAHAVAMFSFATINSSMSMIFQSNSYVDNRSFPGIDEEFPPGPFGYDIFSYYNVMIVIPNITTFLNQWLADGLLVRSVAGSPGQMINARWSTSCIVVTLSMA